MQLNIRINVKVLGKALRRQSISLLKLARGLA